MRWIKKPERPDKLWFLFWPLEVKLGTSVEKGMDTTHTLKIWWEFVRINNSDGHLKRFRISTKDQNGFDYYGEYFEICLKWIGWLKGCCLWGSGAAISAGLTIMFLKLVTTTI